MGIKCSDRDEILVADWMECKYGMLMVGSFKLAVLSEMKRTRNLARYGRDGKYCMQLVAARR